MIGIDIRKKILTYSLFAEELTTVFLGTLLGIKDIHKSKSLGNHSGCLSFNQKIILLTEIGALSKTDTSKFITFMEIRNQFMHNIRAKSYEECFAEMAGKETYIFKLYPPTKTLSKEKQLEEATEKLAGEVLDLITALKDKIAENIHKDVQSSMYKKSQEAMTKSISQLEIEINEGFKKIIEDTPEFDIKKLKNFGSQTSSQLYGLWKKNFLELTKDPDKEVAEKYLSKENEDAIN